MTLLRPNIVYGGYNYFSRYLMQCVLSTRVPSAFSHDGLKAEFSPVHMDDVAKAVHHALGNADAIGKSFALGGADSTTLSRMVDSMKQTVGVDTIGVLPKGGFGMVVDEFFRGITHDMNMVRMAKHYEEHPGDL